MKCELCEVKEIVDVVDPVRINGVKYVCNSCNKILKMTQVDSPEAWEAIKKALKDKKNPMMIMEDSEKVVIQLPNMEGLKKPNAILEINMGTEEALPCKRLTPVGAPVAEDLGLAVHILGKRHIASGVRNYIIVAKYHPKGKDVIKQVMAKAIVSDEQVDMFMVEMKKRIATFFLFGEMEASGTAPMGMKEEDIDMDPRCGEQVER